MTAARHRRVVLRDRTFLPAPREPALEGKIRIYILDDEIEVQPGDSILRALQQYGIARGLPDYGFTRFCWNHKCKQCGVEFSAAGKREHGFACQTDACDGTRVHTLPGVLAWKNKLPVRNGHR